MPLRPDETGFGAAPRLREVASALELAQARELILEYAAWLNVDLGFQHFEAEIAGLPGAYASPGGRLLLAMIEGQAAGCLALRPLDTITGEVKRLWVRPPFRGRGIARMLVEALLRDARSIGYRRLVLDTLAQMREAQSLYRRFGFAEIPAYYDNPLPGTVYLGLDLE